MTRAGRAVDTGNEVRRAGAREAGAATYGHDVIERWAGCVVCGWPISRNVDVRGRPGLWRACHCPDVLWRGGLGTNWERVPLDVADGRRCCVGPLADGRHMRNCVQRCWDCGGDPDGPDLCRCR